MDINKIEIAPFDNLLVYKKWYTREIVSKIISENNLGGLRIFAILKDDRLETIDFLGDYDFLKKLDVTSATEFDFGFLKRLTSLKKLSINTFGKNGIDISPLINLEYFAIQWRPNVKGFEHCDKLQELLLIDFKPEKDLSKISSVVSLKKLVIKVSSIASLAGIESLANLEEILLGNCRKITSLAPLNELKKLRKITLDGTGKHLDFETLGHLPNIKEFFVVSCKNPPSKQWVAERLPNVLDYRGDWK